MSLQLRALSSPNLGPVGGSGFTSSPNKEPVKVVITHQLALSSPNKGPVDVVMTHKQPQQGASRGSDDSPAAPTRGQ
ncbi:hypothetical protein DPMN_016566 [Dreissena polymorpha]|uniref:Uncharacterized protein n=1 Tax=Dreissena polymorpha TaxID=45954 RepID=A0A9D4NDC1_DREPO|nr:hypothetical protein DPMN_016566 [Dreissena polymorpha]